MHQSLQIVTPSTCEPLTRLEAKEFLRIPVDVTDDDFLLEALVPVARKTVEQRTGRFFFQTSVALHCDVAPSESTGVIRVPAMPLVSVSAITSYDSTDGATVMSSSDYTVDTYSEPGRIALRNAGMWPTDVRTVNGIKVEAIVGYSSSTQDGSTGLPADAHPMLQAVKLLLAHLYENREPVSVGVAVAEMPLTVDYLLSGLIVPEVAG